MTTSTTPSVAEDLVMSASQEGLGECIGGPTTLKHGVFCLAFVSKDLKALETKTSTLRRLGGEDPRAKKASKTKAPSPKRLR
jgi:hypothetical protein